MKKSIYNLLLLMIATMALMLNACKKESSEDDSVSAEDATSVSNTINTTSNDAASAAGQVTSFSGKTEGILNGICGFQTVDSSTAGKLVITYDGISDCLGLTRSGSITITLSSGTRWQDAGAVLTITYNSLKATDYITGASYTLNGTQTITNVIGGLAWQIAVGLVENDSAIHTLYSTNMSITFPNGSQRTWSVNRTVKLSSYGTTPFLTLSYYSLNAGGEDTWGTNRYGNNFTNFIETTIASDNTCLWKPYTGETTHTVSGRTTTVLYGTNAAGAADGSPTVCALGYFITYDNGAKTLFVRYW